MERLIGIISDDFTGANDSGIQLVENGISTSVFFDVHIHDSQLEEGLVIDTNSRNLSTKEAFKINKTVGSFLKTAKYKTIIKKIDSTLRGHIGTELLALEEVLQPTFIIIVPSLPMYNRITKNGIHYLDGNKVSETEISKDIRHPIKDSHIPSLLKSEINKEVGLLKTRELGNNSSQWGKVLKRLKENSIKFIVCDAETEEDLICLSKNIYYFEKNILWAASAGLVRVLPKILDIQKKVPKVNFPKMKQSFIVCGSLSYITKLQVDFLINKSNIYPVEINATHILSDNWPELQSKYVDLCLEGFEGKNDLLIFLSNEEKSIKQVKEMGNKLNLTSHQIGLKISESIGGIVSLVLNEPIQLNNLILTGGDISKSVAGCLGAIGFKLISQPAPGMPLGYLIGLRKKIYAVTKAGAFGENNSIYKILKYLKG